MRQCSLRYIVGRHGLLKFELWKKTKVVLSSVTISICVIRDNFICSLSEYPFTVVTRASDRVKALGNSM